MNNIDKYKKNMDPSEDVHMAIDHIAGAYLMRYVKNV